MERESRRVWSLIAPFSLMCSTIVPTGLVHWSRFDEREFWRQARRAERGVSGRLRDALRATLWPKNLL